MPDRPKFQRKQPNAAREATAVAPPVEVIPTSALDPDQAHRQANAQAKAQARRAAAQKALSAKAKAREERLRAQRALIKDGASEDEKTAAATRRAAAKQRAAELRLTLQRARAVRSRAAPATPVAPSTGLPVDQPKPPPVVLGANQLVQKTEPARSRPAAAAPRANASETNAARARSAKAAPALLRPEDSVADVASDRPDHAGTGVAAKRDIEVPGVTADQGGQSAPPTDLAPVAEPQADIWEGLDTFPIDERHLERNRIITARRNDPAHAAFDVLRTRLLHVLADRGWRRVAITSPTKDCGKTFTAANLAISLARQENCRTLLLDCDMRQPSLHQVMGAKDPGSIGDMFRGDIRIEHHLQRLGPNAIHAGRNIAFGFNGITEPYAAELLQEPRTVATLQQMEDLFDPDVVLFDLPPALYSDDVIALRPQFDGVLLVVGGGLTTQKEVREVERRLGDTTPLLGTILNMAEDTEIRKYAY